MTEIKKKLLALLELVEKDEKAMLDIDATNLPLVVHTIGKCNRDYVTVELKVGLHRGDGEPEVEWGIYDNKPKGQWFKAPTLKGAFQAWKSALDIPEEVDLNAIAGIIQPSIRHEIHEAIAQITEKT